MNDHASPVEPVPFIDLVSQYQTIAPEIQEAVAKVFAEQRFVLGEEVALLETEVAKYCDAREAIGCASGTDALVLTLMAMNIGYGSEVITTPFTFFATASAIHRVGATPVFVDIDPDTYNIDIEQVEKAITPRTKAVLPVHLFGRCADMEPLWRLAVKNGLSVIEDACQAIGSEYQGRRAGVLGHAGCFSFFPTKNLGGAGDGGMITTDDPDLARRLRSLRVHGESGYYKHVEVGLNSRLDALQAAVLRVKLSKLDQWTEARRENASCYQELTAHYGIQDAVSIPGEAEGERHVYNQYTIRVTDGDRDTVLQNLRDQQVGCGVYYPVPLHLQDCFSYLSYKEGDLPHSETAAKEVMSLPIFPELSVRQLEQTIRSLTVALGRTVSEEWLYDDDKPIPFSKVA